MLHAIQLLLTLVLFLWREQILEKLLSLQLIQDAVIDHLS